MKLKLTIEKSKEIHDGYCSDPDNIRDEKSQMTLFFDDFPNKGSYNPDLMNEDFSGFVTYGIIENDPQICRFVFEEIQKLNDPTKTGCKLGSGYCGCYTRYYLKKMKIIKEKKY